MSYLADLTFRLAVGLNQLDSATVQRHAAYLKSAQRADGGFAGREGESDLYYSGFAARGLMLTGELQGETAARLANFLRSRMTSRAPIVDLLSLVYAGRLLELAAETPVFDACSNDWKKALADTLEALRREDGGYAKGPDGQKSSTYHSFLVLLCHELIEVPTPAPERIIEFVLSQQRDDGGFVEIEPMRRSGTNPTAAAVGALRILDGTPSHLAQDVADFLAEMQMEDGGIRANTRIPIADLLSTFTGLLTLESLGFKEVVDLEDLKRYVESLDDENGGFYGAEWDQGRDVEYTFYGLGTLALLKDSP